MAVRAHPFLQQQQRTHPHPKAGGSLERSGGVWIEARAVFFVLGFILIHEKARKVCVSSVGAGSHAVSTKRGTPRFPDLRSELRFRSCRGRWERAAPQKTTAAAELRAARRPLLRLAPKMPREAFQTAAEACAQTILHQSTGARVEIVRLGAAPRRHGLAAGFTAQLVTVGSNQPQRTAAAAKTEDPRRPAAPWRAAHAAHK